MLKGVVAEVLRAFPICPTVLCLFIYLFIYIFLITGICCCSCLKRFFVLVKASWLVHCCFSPQRPYGLLMTWSPRRPPRLSHVQVQVQCCLTSTESIRTVRDGEPRTATSTFTRSDSSSVLLNAHKYPMDH